jgi:membrane protease YdiL (CAAX protease family)
VSDRSPGAVDAAIAASAPSGPGQAALGLGLLAATACFSATFQGPRDRFWQRMTLTGLSLGSAALLTSGAARDGLRFRRWHVLAGLASAAALYATFQLGDRFARRYVPGGDQQIREIYTLRTLRPREEIALRLATIIGPAEELFWRGLVQAALMQQLGRWRGGVVAALAYAGVHLVTGNFTLIGAAGVAGAHWCILYSAGVPLGAIIVSHVAWDVWIFLVQPTGETEAVPAAGRPMTVALGA